MKKTNDMLKKAAVISDNLVIKGKITSNASKVTNGRKQKRSAKSGRKKK